MAKSISGKNRKMNLFRFIKKLFYIEPVCKFCIEEGKVKKGGKNPKPKTPRPSKPPGAGGKVEPPFKWPDPPGKWRNE